jgi:opacity protein-like surface antigen
MMFGQVNNKTSIWGCGLAVMLGLGVAEFSNATWAGDWYGGIGVGKSVFKDQKDTCSSLGSILTSRTNCDFDLKDFGTQVFGGYQLNTYAGVELGYIDFGKLVARANGTLAGSPATGNAEFKAKTFAATVVGTLPVGDTWGIIGRFGFHRWKVDAPGSATTSTGSTTVTTNPSKTGHPVRIAVGAGVKYDFTKQIGMRVEWNRYDKVGDQPTTGESSSIDLYSASLVYTF